MNPKVLKFIPTLVTTLLAVIGVNNAAVSEFITAHPSTSVILAAIYALVKGLLPSPVVSTPPAAK